MIRKLGICIHLKKHNLHRQNDMISSDIHCGLVFGCRDDILYGRYGQRSEIYCYPATTARESLTRTVVQAAGESVVFGKILSDLNLVAHQIFL